MTTDQSERVCWVPPFHRAAYTFIMLEHWVKPSLVIKEASYLPLVTQRVSSHLRGHSLLIESTQLALIIDFNQLLAASSGEWDVQLENRTTCQCYIKLRTRDDSLRIRNGERPSHKVENALIAANNNILTNVCVDLRKNALLISLAEPPTEIHKEDCLVSSTQAR